MRHAHTVRLLAPKFVVLYRLSGGSGKNDAADVSANIGCIQHLQTGTETPVRHWVEVLHAALV